MTMVTTYSFIPTGIFSLYLFISLARLSDCCSPPRFPESDPCENITCPYGRSCVSTRDYYCDSYPCALVATCGPKSQSGICTIALPCASFLSCVDHIDQCTHNGTLCTFRSQCDLASRPGQCPIGITVSIGDCGHPGTGCFIGIDANCPGNYKCCSALNDDHTPAPNICSPVQVPVSKMALLPSKHV